MIKKIVCSLLTATAIALLLVVTQTTATETPTAVREVYFPNTEPLAADEMRVIACGTGLPTQRLSQAAACFLVELGNGDKFIFDTGSGSATRLASLEIPYDLLDKVFLSHLHTDHFGDLVELLIGGWVAGRSVPLRIWGPSGATPELGTSYAMEHLKKTLNWDISGRAGRLPPSGGELEVHEFDFRGENTIIYDERGVTIRSFPQIHALDGSVGFTLEWNGLKFVYGGDSYPSKWFIKYAGGADLVIHEAMMVAEDWIGKLKFPPALALEVGTQIHTSPEGFGKIMREIRPRMAVAYHFYNDFDTRSRLEQGIRRIYDGPLTLAEDFLVWNVRKDAIEVRLAAVNENAWPPPRAYPVPAFDRSQQRNPSDAIQAGAYDVTDVDQRTYDRINARYGLNLQMRMKAFLNTLRRD